MNEADERAQAENPVRRTTAQLYRDGLLIALLALAPLRRRNLADLIVGRTLVRGGKEWRIVLRASDMKNARDYEIVLTPLSEKIDRFIALFRPAFFRSDKHPGLLASSKGVPMTGDAIYGAICRRTKSHFGKSVNPHLFRDGAATFWALNSPECIRGVSALLGHADPKTLRHYNQAASIVAGRRLAAILGGKSGY
jgi:integrase